MKNLEKYLIRFQEIVRFLTLLKIKENFKSFEDYQKSPNSRKALKLHIDQKIIRKLTITNDRKTHLKEFLEKSANFFRYHKGMTKTYEFGKTFRRLSWFEIKNLSPNSISDLNTRSSILLSKESHIWIDRHIFGYETKKTTKKAKIMTKLQKNELYEREKAGTLALPAEKIIKDIEKQERRKAKSEAKKIERISKACWTEQQAKLTALEAENKKLKEDLARLQSCDIELSEISAKFRELEARQPKYLKLVKLFKKLTTDLDFLESFYDKTADKIIAKSQDDSQMLQDSFQKTREENTIKHISEVPNFQNEPRNKPQTLPQEQPQGITPTKVQQYDNSDIPDKEVVSDKLLRYIDKNVNLGTFGPNEGRFLANMIGCTEYKPTYKPTIPQDYDTIDHVYALSTIINNGTKFNLISDEKLLNKAKQTRNGILLMMKKYGKI